MSDLLNKASLVVIPSGYKEDTVYSVVPSDGSGDLSFTRASNGTRINSAGLVEVCPWNLLEYSEDFSNATWGKVSATITTNTTVAPNGTTTADTLVMTSGGYLLQQPTISIGVGFALTISIYAKNQTNNFLLFGGATPAGNDVYTIQDAGNGWYRHINTRTFTASGTSVQFIIYDQVGTNYIWGAQLNIGSTAKPYFPTTDRLNVPRLTYQNGGGGCPSLLLEKQSTNTILYSEQFDNAAWLLANGGGTASGSVTSNYGISPDGTQNADRIQLNKGNTGYSEIYQLFNTTNGLTYTQTIWLKSLSGTPKINFGYTGSTRGTITLTTEWQRYEFTYVSGGTTNAVGLTLYDGFDPSTAQSIDVLAWGAQAELSSYPTSYIPTTSASATRVADACSKTGISSLIGQTEGVMFVDMIKSQSGYNYYNLSDGTNNNRIFIGQDADSPDRLRAYIRASGATASVDINVGPVANGRYKMAIGYKLNDVVFYINGTLSGTDTNTAMPTGLSDLSLTNGTGGVCDLTNNVNQVALFKTRLTNAELASLTTI